MLQKNFVWCKKKDWELGWRGSKWEVDEPLLSGYRDSTGS